ncbi:hypothetical protein PAHAL_2G116700 [Panicum hallii]|uniref:Uncharacterized protein n=1 Tax=Panicum hallii TaxID=206008 RepID=A0A2T8KNV5_9POAL|nr:hypothetical protein PAHAL_2G116700 [Panicum hallii]
MLGIDLEPRFSRGRRRSVHPSVPHRRQTYAHPIPRAIPSPTESSSERPTPPTVPATFRSCSRDRRAGKPLVRCSGRGGLAALATQVAEMEEEGEVQFASRVWCFL